jgi:dTDP-4-amino-4,6-dideoxygalactose transaminase
MSENKKITVTSPLLPKLEDFIPMLQDIWDRKWLTNNGHYHQELEKALAEYLGVEYISLFTNGTLPLITSLQALKITGEVITTPYSFVATTHAIWWNGLKPVFVDVEEETGLINPEKIEAAITPKTSAIMPVHVYGNPCNMERIQEIAQMLSGENITEAALTNARELLKR